MSGLQQLQETFGIPGVVKIDAGPGNLPRVVVTTKEATAHIYLHGGHVTHYQPAGSSPLLFVSRDSLFADGKAIRGGVPVIFPWFGANATNPKAPAHGFARSRSWELVEVVEGPEGVQVVLSLRATDATKAFWPHDFEVRHYVTVGNQLEMTLEVRNLSNAAFVCESALHTYLAVGDVRKTPIEGLAGRTYIDKVDHMAKKTQGDAPILLTGETDRVYLGTEDTVTVRDVVGRRTIYVAKSGSNSTVVWNPWSEKAKGFTDFGDDEWPNMVCVETANAADDARTVAPGGHHRLTSVIRVEAGQ